MIEDALSFLWRSLVGPTKEDDEKWMEDGRASDKFKNETNEERVINLHYYSVLRDSTQQERKQLNMGCQDVMARYPVNCEKCGNLNSEKVHVGTYSGFNLCKSCITQLNELSDNLHNYNRNK